MLPLSPVQLILIGFVLVVVGAVLPFLMVLGVVKSTFFLNYFSFGASLVGLFLGVIGSARYVRQKRK
jgi:uncharacterized Tic20 family protein